jgi:hypothetical protein
MHSKHLRHKLLREWKGIAANPVMSHEKPTRATFINGMRAIARGALRDLVHQCKRVAQQKIMEFWGISEKSSECARLDAESATCMKARLSITSVPSNNDIPTMPSGPTVPISTILPSLSSNCFTKTPHPH